MVRLGNLRIGRTMHYQCLGSDVVVFEDDCGGVGRVF